MRAIPRAMRSLATQMGFAEAPAIPPKPCCKGLPPEALPTRQLVGQAVGLVIASQKVDSDAAFDMLVRISQNTNVKLRDLAERLINRSSEA